MGTSAPHPTTDQVKAMIKQFSGQANTLVIPRVFIDFTGDHLAALLLSQVLYWSDRTTDPDGWFYKTADEWQAELGMSAYQVKRASTALATLGIITKLRKVQGAPRMHYRVDMPQFTDLFLKFLENQETRKSTSLKIKKLENGLSRNSKNMDFQETSKSSIHRLPESTDREGGAPTRAFSDLALAIAEVCMIDPQIATDKQKRDLNATYKALHSIGATAADVRAREVWWYSNDWRAKKEGRAPRPDELRAIWKEAAAPIKKQSNGARPPADLPLVTAAADTKQVATPEERRRIIEARRTS